EILVTSYHSFSLLRIRILESAIFAFRSFSSIRKGVEYRDSSSLDCKVYVGDLGSGASKQELEEAFGYYGPLRNVWVARNPPGFAFIEFEDSRDAEDSVRALDGRTVCGRRVRVEMSNGFAISLREAALFIPKIAAMSVENVVTMLGTATGTTVTGVAVAVAIVAEGLPSLVLDPIRVDEELNLHLGLNLEVVLVPGLEAEVQAVLVHPANHDLGLATKCAALLPKMASKLTDP
uniref:RRM domain-containing protein n=1 Tax=Strigamia maritima TaxID=126957 RepID=T1JLW6_STRMM